METSLNPHPLWVFLPTTRRRYSRPVLSAARESPRARARHFREKWIGDGLVGSEAFARNGGPGPEAFLYAVSLARALELSAAPLLGGASGLPEVFAIARVGAPGRIGSPARQRFELLVSAAFRMVVAVGPEPEADAIFSVFAHSWREAAMDVALPPEEKRVLLLSEVLAAVRALDATYNEGENFMIADVGATTSELAVLRAWGGKINLWHAESFPVGVDHFGPSPSEDELGADVLKVRQSRVGAGGKSRFGALADGEERGIQRTAKRLSECVRRVTHCAVKLNKDRPSWAELNILLVGGGSHIRPLAQTVYNASERHPWITTVHRRSVHLPKIEVVGASAERLGRGEKRKLACVLGLTRPVWEDDQFSDNTFDPEDPIVHDDVAEIRRSEKRRRW